MKNIAWYVCLVLGLELLSPASGLAQDSKTRFKIDAHYHYRDNPEFIPQTVETCRKHNTMVCVFTPIQGLERTREAAQKYPDVFIPMGSIRLDDPQALEQIERFHKAGFKGIGELSRPRKDYHDAAYYSIYEKIQSYGMHAMFHTGIVARRNPNEPQTEGGMTRMRPAFLDEIARRFSKLTIQGAHLGNPWYEEAAEASRWNPNLFFDLTGSSLIKKKDNPRYWGEVLWWRPSLATMHSPSAGEHAFEKIVFGTDEDSEGLLPNIERFELLLKANQVPEAVQEKCWSGTMARILRITPRKSR